MMERGFFCCDDAVQAKARHVSAVPNLSPRQMTKDVTGFTAEHIAE
jgi:hypothetical protein